MITSHRLDGPILLLQLMTNETSMH